MRLDQPAINALQIFPKDMEKKILAGSNTIFEILNKCKTLFGTRCLKRWIRPVSYTHLDVYKRQIQLIGANILAVIPIVTAKIMLV